MTDIGEATAALGLIIVFLLFIFSPLILLLLRDHMRSRGNKKGSSKRNSVVIDSGKMDQPDYVRKLTEDVLVHGVTDVQFVTNPEDQSRAGLLFGSFMGITLMVIATIFWIGVIALIGPIGYLPAIGMGVWVLFSYLKKKRMRYLREIENKR